MTSINRPRNTSAKAGSQQTTFSTSSSLTPTPAERVTVTAVGKVERRVVAEVAVTIGEVVETTVVNRVRSGSTMRMLSPRSPEHIDNVHLGTLACLSVGSKIVATNGAA